MSLCGDWKAVAAAVDAEVEAAEAVSKEKACAENGEELFDAVPDVPEAPDN